MCPHHPPCPSASDPDRDAARVVAGHPEQGWSLLCNGVVLFEDTGELLPSGAAVPPHRWGPRRGAAMSSVIAAPSAA
jgi:Family of unknown function (DUF5999)